jgi:hypothetical protein
MIISEITEMILLWRRFTGPNKPLKERSSRAIGAAGFIRPLQRKFPATEGI